MIRVIPRSIIVPRTAICHAGDTLLIGGLGKVDVDEVMEHTDSQPNKYNIINRPVYVSLMVKSMKTCSFLVDGLCQ